MLEFLLQYIEKYTITLLTYFAFLFLRISTSWQKNRMFEFKFITYLLNKYTSWMGIRFKEVEGSVNMVIISYYRAEISSSISE